MIGVLKEEEEQRRAKEESELIFEAGCKEKQTVDSNDANSKENKFISPNLKPYRMLTALLDKSEIGPVVIEDVIIDVFRTLFHYYCYSLALRVQFSRLICGSVHNFEPNIWFRFCFVLAQFQ